MPLPSAIGFLRSDVSGARRQWDEIQIRSAAARLGYDLRKIVVFSATTERPVYRLRLVVDRLGIDAIVTPSIAHFDAGEVPADLVAVVDIITLSPEHTYARASTPAETSGGSDFP
ncbi:MAG: hypothetical protein JWN03_5859 [Nocardia sp.]|uniref:hypothetical protein n=1 Tax=Nocardia sp. TaxID=1821 RepID=UPI0026129248|nr:hypothetical protein [Nocardia sp.]MCU1645584.1 hypothetical protein [Nocardia sp.]